MVTYSSSLENGLSLTNSVEYKWYPKCIQQYNIGPDTIVRGGRRREGLLESLINLEHIKETNEAKELGLSLAANGSMYRKDKLSVFSQVVDELFTKRKTYKKEMKKFEQEVEDIKHTIHTTGKTKELQDRLDWLYGIIATRDAQQMAMKIAINSLYGASGNAGFRYYDPSIAEGITQSGQLAVRYIGKRVSEWMDDLFKTETGFDRWIYSDTDSCFFTVKSLVDLVSKGQPFDKGRMIDVIDKFCADRLEPFIEKCYNELSLYMNAYANEMSMKREVISDAAIFRAKKNYVMQVWDNEGVRYETPKLKMMGIETARSTTPDFVKDALVKSYKIMLNGENQQLLEFLTEFKKEYLNTHYDLLSTPRGVNQISKWIESNGSYKKGIPYHVKAACEYNRLLKEHGLSDVTPIGEGSKVRILTIVSPSPVIGNYIAYIGELPSEFGLEQYIDRETLYEKSFLSPVESFTSKLGWKHLDEYDIMDFFS